MGEQTRRLMTSAPDFVHRSIREAIAWHQTMRRRAKARACIDTIYIRPTPEPAPKPKRPRLMLTPEVRALLTPRSKPIRVKPTHVRRPNAERDAFRAAADVLRHAKLALIVELQNQRCYLCAEPFTKNATMDHVVPRVRGGANAGNVLAAHPRCNVLKDSRMPFACEVLFLGVINELMREPG